MPICYNFSSNNRLPVYFQLLFQTGMCNYLHNNLLNFSKHVFVTFILMGKRDIFKMYFFLMFVCEQVHWVG